MIPIIIVCHNNGWMVEKTINDIYDKFTKSNFIIVDNASTTQPTLDILEKLINKPRVILHRFTDNGSPRRIFFEPSLYKYTKNPYIITDPDLDLSTLPNNTIDTLMKIAMKYKTFKVGLAIDISQKDDLFSYVYENEKIFWTNKINDSNYELYNAQIDTTFCLICNLITTENKDFWQNNIRVAGPYTIKHLPFHKSYIDSLEDEKFNEYFNNNDREISSNTSEIIKYRKSK